MQSPSKTKDEGWALSANYEEQMISAERLVTRGNAKGTFDLFPTHQRLSRNVVAERTSESVEVA
jgi:hypothetical protein